MWVKTSNTGFNRHGTNLTKILNFTFSFLLVNKGVYLSTLNGLKYLCVAFRQVEARAKLEGNKKWAL